MADKLFQDYNSVINVKDSGAIGDGVTDDTAAVQAAFNAAFGSFSSPNADTATSNKQVYFPAGTYHVVAPAAINITGAANNGSGKIRLTVTSTTAMLTGMIVSVGNITGTVSAEAHGTWGITVIDGTHIDLSGTTFSGAYTSGGKVCMAALNLRFVKGTKIFGAGRFSTSIGGSSGTTLSCNALSYSVIEGINFACGTNANSLGSCIDIGGDGSGAGGSGNSQSNTIQDCFFGGGDYGVRVGTAGQMGSEQLFINNYFNAISQVGIISLNGNACDNTVIGGNIAGCDIGIRVVGGGINTINGVSFQTNTSWDISVESSPSTGGDSYSISGCRSESSNFAQLHSGIGAHLSGITHIGSGVFAFTEASAASPLGPGSLQVDGCASNGGTITGNGKLFVRGSPFGNNSIATTTASFAGTVCEWNNGAIAVGSLPAAATKYKGLRMVVTDSSVTTFNSTVAGGGSATVGVICDGSNWKIG